ncbi:DNA methyltransferase [Aureimonas endophytica]|uniref:DNA methyltransferase n=1 Tax=Aureimonas endophytica TaxID=2027858 RepID=A0A917E0I0_9HYPH|nr:DNA adenine methylase [Aureimonas endophytica]GGD87948.1 DNA methyltransferase [Aureimonas endophytica]
MSAVVALRRPAVRYFGGKWHQAPFLVRLFPAHRTYVEPFGGGASVLLRKPKAPVEVLNDVDDNVVALYRVLADPQLSRQLAFDCYLTPFRSSVLADAFRVPDDADDLTRARKLVTRGALAYNSSVRPKTGSGAGIRPPQKSAGRGTTPAQDWATYRKSVPGFHARLREVRISQRPAIDVMRDHDGADTLHYCDPPYVPATRMAPDKGYRHEMTVQAHVELLEVLRSLRGYVVLSGYPSTLYDDTLVGWTRIDRSATDGGGNRRTESVWMNPRAAEATMSSEVRQLSLF